ADTTTDPEAGLAVGVVVKPKSLARLRPRRQLAERKRVGDEPHAVLDAMGGAVAESLGRGDAPPLILESRAAAAYSWPARRSGMRSCSRYADNDFAKMCARGHVLVARPRLIEGEHLIDDRLNAARRHRTTHRLKHLHRAH